MNIHEILKTGVRKLRRKSWQDTQFIYCDPTQFFVFGDGNPERDDSISEDEFHFSLTSLTANDWEPATKETYLRLIEEEAKSNV